MYEDETILASLPTLSRPTHFNRFLAGMSREICRPEMVSAGAAQRARDPPLDWNPVCRQGFGRKL